MPFKSVVAALLLVAFYAAVASALVMSTRHEDSESGQLPVGLSLLPIRDQLVSGPPRAANGGTRVAIADSNIIVTGTRAVDVVETIEDVVSRDQSHNDADLTEVIVGIMGVDAPDAALKQQIRAALALRRGSTARYADASRAFHDRIMAIVAALPAAPRSDPLDTELTTVKDRVTTASSGDDQFADKVDARLQPLVGVLVAVNSLL